MSNETTNKKKPVSEAEMRARVSVYPPEAATQFAIDNVKLIISPRFPHKFIHRHASALDANSLQKVFRLPASAGLELSRLHSQATAKWVEERGLRVQQALGSVRGQDGKIWQSLDWNPLRACRNKLIDAGRQVDLLGAPRVRVRHDNFIDPSVVDPVEVHKACLDELAGLIERRSTAYLETVQQLFGLQLHPHDIQVSVNVIEFAWDRPCREARLAASLWRSSWRATFARPEQHGNGVLKGRLKAKSICKLYPKTDHILRFEAQLTRKFIKKLLGRRPNLSSATTMTADLESAAAKLYRDLLRAQGGLVVSRPLPLSKIIGAFVPDRQSERAIQVFNSLVVDGQVKCPDQATYSLLSRLRSKGLVEVGAARGFWVPTPECRETLHFAERAIRNFGEP